MVSDWLIKALVKVAGAKMKKYSRLKNLLNTHSINFLY